MNIGPIYVLRKNHPLLSPSLRKWPKTYSARMFQVRARQFFGHFLRDGKSKEGVFFWEHRWDLCSPYAYGFNPVHESVHASCSVHRACTKPAMYVHM